MNFDDEWYSVKCIFEHPNPTGDEATRLYEERVIILLAYGLTDAVESGKQEAEQYARDCNIEYRGFIDAYHLNYKAMSDGTEVYSVMRESSLDADVYIDRYYDDGKKTSQTWEDPDSE